MLKTRAVGPEDWKIVAQLFGSNGACGGCWCMWWRVPHGGKTWEAAKGPRNRERFRKLLCAGEVHALLAFDGDEPVGWCSLGPRESFPRIDSVKALRRPVAPDTWAIVCFFIPSKWRGQGVATALIDGAKQLAFERGAQLVEGYPVVPSKPPAQIPAAFAWTGVPALFERAGFAALPRAGATRPIFVAKAGRRRKPGSLPFATESSGPIAAP